MIAPVHEHLLHGAFVFKNKLTECWAPLVLIVMPLHYVTVYDSLLMEENMGGI